ncbi:MAG: hypothetical protein CVV59_00230 [Tenericutes bacterium HGW-Tenericutes-4]|nr:MAG: hypothetical protein CVV59_00230 [Tenericutes bacterium HGW-Tenericutes-4]
MNENTKRKFTNVIFVLTAAVIMLTVYLLDPSFAWFTDNQNFLSEDDLPKIQVDLLDVNNNSLTSMPSFIYTGATSYDFVIRAKNTDSSNISAIIRILIMASWSGGLPVYNNGNTLSYQFNSASFIESSVGDVGFNYLYYNSVLAPNSTVNFLSSVSVPNLPASYLNKTLSLSIAITGLQANPAGVNVWKTQGEIEGRAPLGWNPLGV